jgi:hypothetical protein
MAYQLDCVANPLDAQASAVESAEGGTLQALYCLVMLSP